MDQVYRDFDIFVYSCLYSKNNLAGGAGGGDGSKLNGDASTEGGAGGGGGGHHVGDELKFTGKWVAFALYAIAKTAVSAITEACVWCYNPNVTNMLT